MIECLPGSLHAEHCWVRPRYATQHHAATRHSSWAQGEVRSASDILVRGYTATLQHQAATRYQEHCPHHHHTPALGPIHCTHFVRKSSGSCNEADVSSIDLL